MREGPLLRFVFEFQIRFTQKRDEMSRYSVGFYACFVF